VASTAEAYALLLQMEAIQATSPLSRHDAEVAIGRLPHTNDVRTWGALLLSDPREPLPQRLTAGRHVLDALCCVALGVADFRAACKAPNRGLTTIIIPYLKGLHDAAWTQTLPRPPLPMPFAASALGSPVTPVTPPTPPTPPTLPTPPTPATSPELPIAPTTSEMP